MSTTSYDKRRSVVICGERVRERINVGDEIEMPMQKNAANATVARKVCGSPVRVADSLIAAIPLRVSVMARGSDECLGMNQVMSANYDEPLVFAD